jgi:hypothetical protein
VDGIILLRGSQTDRRPRLDRAAAGRTRAGSSAPPQNAPCSGMWVRTYTSIKWQSTFASSVKSQKFVGKKSLDNPTYGVGSHHPRPVKPDVLPPNYLKPDKSPLRQFWTAVCYSKVGFVFFFPFFISAESLKKHSKSQKNHKMENLILLDST